MGHDVAAVVVGAGAGTGTGAGGRSVPLAVHEWNPACVRAPRVHAGSMMMHLGSGTAQLGPGQLMQINFAHNIISERAPSVRSRRVSERARAYRGAFSIMSVRRRLCNGNWRFGHGGGACARVTAHSRQQIGRVGRCGFFCCLAAAFFLCAVGIGLRPCLSATCSTPAETSWWRRRSTVLALDARGCRPSRRSRGDRLASN